MSETREQIIQEIKQKIANYVQDQDKMFIITSIIASTLDNYDVKKRTTEVATGNDSNSYIIEMYVSHLLLSGNREKTIKLYVTRLNHFSTEMNIDLLKVSSIDIQRYLASFIVQKKSKTYIQNIRAVLSSFYTWLNKFGYIQTNPIDRVEFIRSDTKQEDPFSEEEIATMRDSCKNSLQRALLEFLLSSGMRVGEVQKVKLEHINLDTREIYIPDGKGGKQRYTYMNPVCVKYLKEYMIEYDPKEYLFQSNRKKQRSIRSFESIVESIGESSGVSNVHPHRFRHTFSTRMVANGCPVQDLQKLLGHSGLDTTMIYVTRTKESIKNSYTRYAVM